MAQGAAVSSCNSVFDSLMDVASIPWECVASFLRTQEIVFLRTAVTYLNEANLYGEYGPLLFLLMQHEAAKRINRSFDKSSAQQEYLVCPRMGEDWRCNEMFHWWPTVPDLSFLVQVPPYPAVSQLTLLIIESFFAAVHEAPTTIEVQETVVAALMSARSTNPEHLVGTTDSVIGGIGRVARRTSGLLKRTFRCAEAKRAKAAASTLTSGSLISVLGPEASAGAVASALKAGRVVVDLNVMLEKGAVKDLPYHLRPQPALFQLLAAAHKSAQEAVPARKAYTYVDLTHKDVLPLGSEAVGGHTLRPGEFDWDPTAHTASLGALGRAFKGALEKPRYMVQWSAVWHRYAVAAVAMGQMTWPMVLSHANQMYKLAEEERISGTGPALVFVYDELLRKSIATRAEWGDPSLDLMTSFGEVEKQVLEAARTRMLHTGFWNKTRGIKTTKT